MSVEPHPRPVSRAEWERLVRRADLQPITKFVGFTIAQWSTARTGGDIYPGVARLARVCRLDEKTIRRHLAKLRDEGFLVREQEEDWRRRATLNIADVYQLTCPADYLERVGYLTPNEEFP